MKKISKSLSAIVALTSMIFVGFSSIAFKEKPSVKETQPNIIIVNFDAFYHLANLRLDY